MKVSSNVLLNNICDDLSFYLKGNPPEITYKQFSANMLVESLLKKFVGERFDSRAADKAALDLFLETNSSLLEQVKSPSCLLDEYLIGEVKNSLYQFWYESSNISILQDPEDLFKYGRMGPGSSFGVKGQDFYTKFFSSTLSATSHLLYNSYRRSLEAFPSWLTAEKQRSLAYGSLKTTRYSKLLFVPKRNTISRTICTEPSLNMFYQLGFGRILEDRLRTKYAIHLDTQPTVNRELARLGSIDNSFATIDLSSASDSLSVGVLKQILPAEFFYWLDLLRTPQTMLPDGSVVDLRMISTMGNGFTFPLETLIFTSVVDASYRIAGIPLVRNTFVSGKLKPGNFAVFGDDIIVETRVSSLVLRLLDLLGFKVNVNKTFTDGPFRESCGNDWFSGHFVRGVYLKTLETPQDRYVAINLLNRWSACNGIPLPRAVSYLHRTVYETLVPYDSSLDCGIHVPLSRIFCPRFNLNGAVKYRCFEPKSFSIRYNDTTDRFSSFWSSRTPNHEGLFLSFVAGYIRSGKITLRQRVVKYRLKNHVTPSWDNVIAEVGLNSRLYCFTQWETAVWANLA